MWLEEDQNSGRADELRQIKQYMLIVRVQAVGCKIAGGEVVDEVIKGCDNGVIEEGGPSDWVVSVEGRIEVDRDKCSQETGYYHGNERPRPAVLISLVLGRGYAVSPLDKMR